MALAGIQPDRSGRFRSGIPSGGAGCAGGQFHPCQRDNRRNYRNSADYCTFLPI